VAIAYNFMSVVKGRGGVIFRSQLWEGGVNFREVKGGRRKFRRQSGDNEGFYKGLKGFGLKV